jgi:hypothetical protein
LATAEREKSREKKAKDSKEEEILRRCIKRKKHNHMNIEGRKKIEWQGKILRKMRVR